MKKGRIQEKCLGKTLNYNVLNSRKFRNFKPSRIKMSSSWKKQENKDGFPYYINELTKETQWDHFKFREICRKLDECNYVKYSMYRVALKFRVLQSALFMQDVSLCTVVGVFERHRLGSNESSLCLENCDLEAILSDIYFASNKINQTNVDIDLAADLTINLLYNIFDMERLGKLQVSCVKILLYILSNCSSSELYKSIFSLGADHNNCISRMRLQTLLLKIVEIASFLNEENSYGTSIVNRTIDNCFAKSPGLAGISETAFISWLETSPKIFSWIPLLNRLKMAETVVHATKCTTCKTYPLFGLKYKCMKCFCYTQCQRCFFTGRTSNSHKLSHSMREYCTQGNEQNSAFMKKLCSLVKCSQMSNDSTIIEAQPLVEHKSPRHLQFHEGIVDQDLSPQDQLQTIIKQLEVQNKELQSILLRNCTSKEIFSYLEEYRIHIATQIQHLKQLRDNLLVHSTVIANDKDNCSRRAITESTPLVQTNIKSDRMFAVDLFSPIITNQEEQNSTGNTCSKSEPSYEMDDISTWLGGHPNTSKLNAKHVSVRKSPIKEFHNDLDEALAKLQQILANNFSLDESLCHIDNANLKHAVSEVEGMLTSIIDSVEHSRGSSVRSHRLNTKD